MFCSDTFCWDLFVCLDPLCLGEKRHSRSMACNPRWAFANGRISGQERRTSDALRSRQVGNQIGGKGGEPQQFSTCGSVAWRISGSLPPKGAGRQEYQPGFFLFLCNNPWKKMVLVEPLRLAQNCPAFLEEFVHKNQALVSGWLRRSHPTPSSRGARASILVEPNEYCTAQLFLRAHLTSF